jgi:2,5-diamino-6-(ribosylamino)-4(3H)-pyrimidinone 5'-phosphate reductase
MTRPHVIINCAVSADGKIALPSRKQLRISCDEDIERMYKLRNKYDAVLVGIGTILSDNPRLTVKEKYVKKLKQPIRIILDTYCKTPVDSLAVNDQAKTFIITSKESNKKFNDNVEIIKCKTDSSGLIDLKCLLRLLNNHQIKTLMIEGGGTVIWNFLNQRLVDELFVYIAPVVIGGIKTPTMADGIGIKGVDELICLEVVNINRLGPGVLFHYKTIK